MTLEPKIIVPEEGATKPNKRFRRVDLPEPLGPQMPIDSFYLMLRDRPSITEEVDEG